MKLWGISLVFGTLLSFSFGASAQTQLDGVYIGGKFGSFNSAELENVKLSDVEYSGDFAVGYNIFLDTSASIALEASLGFIQIENDSSSTFSLNFKPKFTVWESDMYIAPLIGIAAFKNDNDTYNGYQYGLELGYQINPHFILSLDYVVQEYEVENEMSLNIDGFSLGLAYQF